MRTSKDKHEMDDYEKVKLYTEGKYDQLDRLDLVKFRTYKIIQEDGKPVSYKHWHIMDEDYDWMLDEIVRLRKKIEELGGDWDAKI